MDSRTQWEFLLMNGIKVNTSQSDLKENVILQLNKAKNLQFDYAKHKYNERAKY